LFFVQKTNEKHVEPVLLAEYSMRRLLLVTYIYVLYIYIYMYVCVCITFVYIYYIHLHNIEIQIEIYIIIYVYSYIYELIDLYISFLEHVLTHMGYSYLDEQRRC